MRISFNCKTIFGNNGFVDQKEIQAKSGGIPEIKQSAFNLYPSRKISYGDETRLAADEYYVKLQECNCSGTK